MTESLYMPPVLVLQLVMVLGFGGLLYALVAVHQRTVHVIHPGWILVSALLFYGIPVPVFLTFWPEIILPIAPSLHRHFSSVGLSSIMWLYLLTLFGFLIGQIFLIAKQSTDSAYRSGLSFQMSNVTLIVVGVIAIGVSAIMFVTYYAPLGGFLGALALDRRDMFHQLSTASGFGRYQLVLQAAITLFVLQMLSRQRSRSMMLLVIGVVLAYASILLLMGSRLSILVLLFGILFVIYVRRRKWLIRQRSVLMLLAVILAVGFSWYGYIRGDIRDAVSSGFVNTSSIAASIFPVEAITGYVPGLIVKSAGVENFSGAYLPKFIPSSLFEFVGLTKPATLSSAVTSYLPRSSGQAVYTFTLPVDLGLSFDSSLWLILVSATLYVVLTLTILNLQRWGNFGLGLATVVFMNLWYVVRVEAGNWFPRLWQGCVIFIALYLIAMLIEYGLRARRIDERYKLTAYYPRATTEHE